LFIRSVEDDQKSKETRDDVKEDVDGTEEDIDVNDKNGNDEKLVFLSTNDSCDGLEMAEPMATSGIVCLSDMLKIRPELALWILSPTKDGEEDMSKPWLELREGHWVVWVSSLLIVGKVLL